MKTSFRKLVSIVFLTLTAILASQYCADDTQSLTPPEETSLELKVTFAPIEVKSTDRKVNLLYCVQVANFEKQGYKLKDFQVLNSSTGNMLCSIKDTGRYMLIHKPVIDSIPKEVFYYPLGGHADYRFSVGLILDPAQVPSKIKHRLILLKDSKENIIEGKESSVSKEQITTFSSPLRGDRFLSANTTALTNNQHPSYQYTYRGITSVPERYCVDWNKTDATGSTFHGDPKICDNWYVYGQNVYSVANGKVISVSDGMADQSPVGTISPDINIFNSGGNSVMIYIAGGYVIYSHLKPNTIIVKAGQSIAKGDLIGKVGNSGNSGAPHLHFGLHTDFPWYIAESIPYYIDALEKVGEYSYKGLPVNWLNSPEQHTNEIVENGGIYNFK